MPYQSDLIGYSYSSGKEQLLGMVADFIFPSLVFFPISGVIVGFIISFLVDNLITLSWIS